MKQSNTGIMIFLLVFSVLIIMGTGLGLWTAMSGFVSIVKVTAGDCGETYQIEQIVNGNWFCFEEKKEG